MPTYNFKDIYTDEEFSEFMSMSELDEYLEKNKHLRQGISAPPAIISGRGRSKPDSGFRDLLKHIKKGNSKGLSKSSINTF